MENRIWIEVDHYVANSENLGTDDDWGRCDQVEMQTDFKKAYINKPEKIFFIDSIVPNEKINGDKIFLVVSKYTDGSSFDTTTGYYRIEGAFNSIESAQTWRQINYGEIKKKYSGYFSSLDSIEIEELNIERG